MALIKCPECGKEISDAAKSCPNCGYPLKNEAGESKIQVQQDILLQKQQAQQQRQGQKQKVNKNKGCLTAAIMAIIIFGIGIGGISTVIKSSLNTVDMKTEIILDANEFSKISSENLVEKLGEPVRIEDFIAPNGATCYNYWYDIDKNHYDFYVIDDKVVELIASSENYWTGKGGLYKYNKKNKSDIAECFNIKLSQNAKVKDKNITYIVESVSSTVEEINVQDIKSDSKTYGLIKIIYDNSYNK